MSSARRLALIGLAALGASVLSGLSVQGVREERMGLARDEQLSIGSVGDVLRAAAWETRVALADLAWLQAELVFHRGLQSEEELHEKPSPLRPWIPEHVHDLDSAAEMMPWVWLTTTLNPHHVRAYAMGGYFLSWQLDRPAQALEYLMEGARANPGDPLIPFTIGKIHLLHRHDAAAAVPPLAHALQCGFPPTEDGLEDELAAVRLLAHALRLTGRWEDGAALWRAAAAHHADDPAFASGRDTFLELIQDEARRDTFDLPELRPGDLHTIEGSICSLGDDEHHHDHEHAEHAP